MELNDANFEQEVLKYEEGPVLVDFFAPWCGPCQMQGPIVEELGKELGDTKAKVFKVNVDENQGVAGKFSVMSIPTLIIFVKGEAKETMMGLQNKDVLKEKLQGLM
jgi:thioredoxin 1